MRFKKAKIIVLFMLVVNILILSAASIQASTKEILVYVDYANTPSGNIGIKATLTVQQSFGGYIIYIDDPKLSSYMADIGIDKNTISLTNPTVWANGAYATVTVTYLLNGQHVQEFCVFYP